MPGSRSPRSTCGALGLALLLSVAPAVRAQEQAAPATVEALVESGRALWEAYAPEAWRETHEFPDAARIEEFLAQLQAALGEGTFEQLAAFEPEARALVALLGNVEGGGEVAAWLEPRLELLRAAGEWSALERAEPAPPPGRARPLRPGEATVPPPRARARLPQGRAYWEARVAAHRPPAAAAELVPRLKRVFRDAGVPAEWVWIAEVESSMNPRARSPAGATGLFQFMPATAERFGMRSARPDERTDPERSARAAAAYLTFLHGRFGDWPLALAAYNAGEGRVGRLLGGGDGGFEGIAERLPAETRLYVPKVLATVAVRERVNPEALPAPRAPGAAR